MNHHALYQGADALRVSVAAANELNGLDAAVLYLNVDGAEQVPCVLYLISFIISSLFSKIILVYDANVINNESFGISSLCHYMP